MKRCSSDTADVSVTHNGKRLGFKIALRRAAGPGTKVVRKDPAPGEYLLHTEHGLSNDTWLELQEHAVKWIIENPRGGERWASPTRNTQARAAAP